MLDHLKRHAIIAFFLCYEHLWLTTTWSYNEDTSKGLIHLVPLPQDLGASDGIVKLFTQWSERNTA